MVHIDRPFSCQANLPAVGIIYFDRVPNAVQFMDVNQGWAIGGGGTIRLGQMKISQFNCDKAMYGFSVLLYGKARKYL